MRGIIGFACVCSLMLLKMVLVLHMPQSPEDIVLTRAKHTPVGGGFVSPTLCDTKAPRRSS